MLLFVNNVMFSCKCLHFVVVVFQGGQYPNTAILLGLLQATDKNFNMLQQQRQNIHIKDKNLEIKDRELQKEKEISQINYRELQRKNEELQREREELQRKDEELHLVQLEAECRRVREQQTHRALLEGQAAVIQRHVQEIRNREQNNHLLHQQTQNYQQQLQQRDQMLYIVQQQLDNQTEQLDNTQQIQENQTEMIRRLAGELKRVGRDPRGAKCLVSGRVAVNKTRRGIILLNIVDSGRRKK